jgi:hypothetical protein
MAFSSNFDQQRFASNCAVFNHLLFLAHKIAHLKISRPSKEGERINARIIYGRARSPAPRNKQDNHRLKKVA